MTERKSRFQEIPNEVRFEGDGVVRVSEEGTGVEGELGFHG